MATTTERLAAEKVTAYRLAFQAILAAIKRLEVERGQTPRELRADGNLGAFVATASSAASEGLQLLSAHERQLAG